MKLSCEIVEDLLPLYEDEACSPQSREAVSAHLQTCEACRRLLSSARSIPVPEIPDTERAVVNGLRRLRRRWWASILAVIVLFPVCVLGWNQLRGQGASFTNLHELYIGNAFVGRLLDGDYQGAYEYIDIGSIQDAWAEEWQFSKEQLAGMERDGLAQFCQAAQMLEEAGGITECRYIGIVDSGSSCELFFHAKVNGEEHRVGLAVTDGGVRWFSCEGSYLTDPLAHFGMWSEYLWQQYAGCSFDPTTGEYVYD